MKLFQVFSFVDMVCISLGIMIFPSFALQSLSRDLVGSRLLKYYTILLMFTVLVRIY